MAKEQLCWTCQKAGGDLFVEQLLSACGGLDC